MSDKPKYRTREEWLLDAVSEMTPLFEQHGYKVPAVNVSCGWPSSRALSSKCALGEAWAPAAAKNKVAHLFISPRLDDPFRYQYANAGVLPTLVHEVVHAVVGNKNGHNKVFGKCARAVGLEGKLTSTHASAALLAECEKIVKTLGPYPHGMLSHMKRPTKKQTTRLVKCECATCGYVCRTTRKWIEEAGAPICPAHKKPMKYEIPDELEEDND